MTVTDQTEPARYRRAAEAQAVQWTGSNEAEMAALCSPFDFQTIDPEDRVEDPEETAAFRTHGHGGWVGLKPGDWVVKEAGRFTKSSDADFRAEWEPAGRAPAAERAALRERIAEALLTTRRSDYAEYGVKANHRQHRFDARCALCTYDVDALADAVLDALPSPDQRSAVRAEIDWIIEHCPEHGCVEPETEVCHCEIAERLRRLAGEAQQEPTPDGTEAHPPHHRWYVETRDGLADEWAPGMRLTDRAEAVERYEALNENHPTWKDGTPVERRIVRETTTYTVEQP
jgi:hypothetical protein